MLYKHAMWRPKFHVKASNSGIMKNLKMPYILEIGPLYHELSNHIFAAFCLLVCLFESRSHVAQAGFTPHYVTRTGLRSCS